jgi:hypothetical protein
MTAPRNGSWLLVVSSWPKRLFTFHPVGVSPNPIRVDPSTLYLCDCFSKQQWISDCFESDSTGARRMFSGTDRFTGTREGSSEGARTSPQMPTQL